MSSPEPRSWTPAEGSDAHIAEHARHLFLRWILLREDVDSLWTQRYVVVSEEALIISLDPRDDEPIYRFCPADVEALAEGDRCISIQPNNSDLQLLIRCCDSHEARQLLDAMERAGRTWRMRSLGIQTDDTAVVPTGHVLLTDAEFQLLIKSRSDANMKELQLQSTGERLREAGAALQALREKLDSVMRESVAALQVAKQQHAALAQDKQRSLAELRKRLQSEHDAQTSALKDIARSAHEFTMCQNELNDLRVQVRKISSELIEERRIRQQLELSAKAFSEFLLFRHTNLSWLRHHLCSEEIARFALSLKRAGQLLAKVPGAEQFATEFSKRWIIVEKLVGLPTRIAEEDQLLARLFGEIKPFSSTTSTMG